MVQIGDVIRLRRSAFENEFLDSDWNVKYMYEDVFKYVSLRFKKLNQPGDMAKTFFGSSDTIVEDIECVYENEPFILLTDLFRIIYPSALENKEINVVSSAEDSLKPLKVQEKLISDLEFFEMNYLEGIFNVMERENNKIATYRTGFYMIKNEGKWSSRK